MTEASIAAPKALGKTRTAPPRPTALFSFILKSRGSCGIFPNLVRVVSLLPSSTEIVVALGLGGELVGRSHTCDYPTEIVEPLPVVTKPRFAIGSARELTGRERAIQNDGAPLYSIDENALRVLSPHVILTQAPCRTGALSYEEVKTAAARLPGPARVVSLEPRRWDDVTSDVVRLAEVLEARSRGLRLVEELSARIEAVQEAVAEAPCPRVLCVEWMDPLIEGGHWMPELIEWGGGAPLFALPGEPSPIVDWDDVLDADPEVIIIAPSGYRIEETLRDIDALRGRPGWQALQAVREGCVFAIDGNAYVNRPGPRLADTLEIVAALVHPDLLPAPRPDRYVRLRS